ncbi:MAG: peptidase dimerization domain-containing protein [Candidatus Aminicenantes bacterium]|nr:peptidase dimerization domain-containing protein [Candidatus Aminicenantes bacterium]
MTKKGGTMRYRRVPTGFLCSGLVILAILLIVPLTETKPAGHEKIQVIPSEDPQTAKLRKAMDSEIEALRLRLIEMNDWMYHHPEPGFLEFKASSLLIQELERHGFEVSSGVPGLGSEWDRLKVIGGFPKDDQNPVGIPTAFKAKYKGKSEHPVIGIAVEYDALRGNPPFHGCQHNMQGPVGVGAAVALTQIMDKHNIPGSVWVIGCPAEEVGPPAKAVMAQTGYFDGIDFMMRSHGTSRETIRYPGGFSARNIRQIKYTFHGKSAHAQSAWEGRSALDAVLLLFHAVDMMREHSEPQFRFHGIISDGGSAPNIVPEKASALMWIRHLIDETPTGSLSPREAEEKVTKKVQALDKMAEGAALATETEVDMVHYGTYIPGIAVRVLNDIAFQYAVEYGGINIGQRAVPRHWEETGFGTLKVPGVHISIGTEGIPRAAGHSQKNADITVSEAGHQSLILTSKVMAAVGLRLVLDPKLRKQAKAEHSEWAEKYEQR